MVKYTQLRLAYTV